MSDDARIEDGLDVLEAIMTAEVGASVMIARDEKADAGERVSVALVVGTLMRTFKGPTLAAAVEHWRTYKLRLYQDAAEVLRR